MVIDKPKGPTSHQVSAWVRSILGLKKAGHVGTLDPNVTGVLPVGLEKATRLADYLHEEGKEYVSLLLLHKELEFEKVESVFREFTGEIYQFPPVRSAVARNLRKRKIYSLRILEHQGRNILFRANVESGVYVRTLCRDIGDALLVGGNMIELRRVRSGPLDETHLTTLQTLKDAYTFYRDGDAEMISKLILDPEDVTSNFPKVVVKDSAIDALAHGSTVFRNGIIEDRGEGEIVRVMSLKGELLAMGRREKDYIKPEAVFVDRGIYPKGWKKEGEGKHA